MSEPIQQSETPPSTQPLSSKESLLSNAGGGKAGWKYVMAVVAFILLMIAGYNDVAELWGRLGLGGGPWIPGISLIVLMFLFAILLYLSGKPYSRWVARGLLVALVALGSVVVLWLRPGEPERLPDVSLVGMSYMVDHWDPRRIDLTRAGESGIPVSTNHLLEFVDIAVSVTEDAPDYVGHIEVYQDNQHKDLVGKSESFPLIKGVKTLEAIQATQYNQRASDDEKDRLIWRVPPDWIGKALHVALVIYRKGQQEAVHVAVTDVLINPAGKAWFLGPPNAALAVVAYNVNGGETKVIDPRVMAEKGLDAKPNDTLNIEEIWYTSNASGGALHTEAYLTAGDFNKQTFKSTRATIAEKGIGALTDISPLHSRGRFLTIFDGWC